MEFRILGPLEVHGESGPLSLRAAKQRTLLAILLLHANEVVSRDRLVDDLWGATPPQTAANALQVYVAQLRKALEPDRARNSPHSVLLTHPGGYQLRVQRGGLDAERFEDLLVQGSSAQVTGDRRRPRRFWARP
jgi:DNA-binding SARP family transcriptional activator